MKHVFRHFPSKNLSLRGRWSRFDEAIQFLRAGLPRLNASQPRNDGGWRITFFLSLMMSTILLTACGQSGPLYLPAEPISHQAVDQTK